MNTDKDIRTVIDTVQVTVKSENMKESKLLDRECTNSLELANCIRAVIGTDGASNCNIHIKVHKIGEDGEQEHYIESLESQKALINTIMENVEVKEWSFNRVDVAIDIDIDFSKSFKLLDFFHSLVIADEYGQGFYSVSKRDYKKNSIKLCRQSFELVIYDKLAERKSRQIKGEYPTRIEFRYKRKLIGSLEIALNETIARLIGGEVKRNNKIVPVSGCIENIEKVEDEMIKILLDKWHNDYKNVNKANTLSSFIRDNVEMVYTRRILEEVYKNSGLKGNFKKWLEKLRASYIGEEVKRLDFITKKDIKEFISKLTKSTKEYRKS